MGDYFDSSVLEAILRFGKAAGVAGVRYEMIPQDSARGKFVLDDDACALAKKRLKDDQSPRACVVSGKLDEIKHGSGRFRLSMNPGVALFGQLDSSSLSVEALRPLWGRLATVEGMVHFKSNGQPRLIEARRISSRLDEDSIFEELPRRAVQESPTLSQGPQGQAGKFDPIELAGAWPGEESMEDLLAQLD